MEAEQMVFSFFFPLQVISIFSVVEVQLRADEGPLKYSAVLKRPENGAA